jgi:hypothetical protein
LSKYAPLAISNASQFAAMLQESRRPPGTGELPSGTKPAPAAALDSAKRPSGSAVLNGHVDPRSGEQQGNCRPPEHVKDGISPAPARFPHPVQYPGLTVAFPIPPIKEGSWLRSRANAGRPDSLSEAGSHSGERCRVIECRVSALWELTGARMEEESAGER